jgi:hypothetical protein
MPILLSRRQHPERLSREVPAGRGDHCNEEPKHKSQTQA